MNVINVHGEKVKILWIMYEVCRIIHWLPKHICYLYGEDIFWSWE